LPPSDHRHEQAGAALRSEVQPRNSCDIAALSEPAFGCAGSEPDNVRTDTIYPTGRSVTIRPGIMMQALGGLMCLARSATFHSFIRERSWKKAEED